MSETTYHMGQMTTITAVFVVGICVALAVSVSAYSPPSAAPPNGNAYSPVHVGGTNAGDGTQSKTSSLAICTSCAVGSTGLLVYGIAEFRSDINLYKATGPTTITVSNGGLVISAPGGGVTVPTMSIGQRDALTGVPDGTILYTTDDDKFNFRENGAWKQLP